MGEVEDAYRAQARALSQAQAAMDNRPELIAEIFNILPKVLAVLAANNYTDFGGNLWRAATVSYNGENVIVWYYKYRGTFAPLPEPDDAARQKKQQASRRGLRQRLRPAPPPTPSPPPRVVYKGLALRVENGQALFLKCDDIKTNVFVDVDLGQLTPLEVTAFLNLLQVIQKGPKKKPWVVPYLAPPPTP